MYMEECTDAATRYGAYLISIYCIEKYFSISRVNNISSTKAAHLTRHNKMIGSCWKKNVAAVKGKQYKL